LAQGWHSFKRAYSNAVFVIQHFTRTKKWVIRSDIFYMKESWEVSHAMPTCTRRDLSTYKLVFHFSPLHCFLTSTVQLAALLCGGQSVLISERENTNHQNEMLPHEHILMKPAQRSGPIMYSTKAHNLAPKMTLCTYYKYTMN